MKRYYIYCPTSELKLKALKFAQLNEYSTAVGDYDIDSLPYNYAIFVDKENKGDSWNKILKSQDTTAYPYKQKRITLNFYNMKFKTI